MTIDEAKEIIRNHYNGNNINTRKFLDAIEVANKYSDKTFVNIEELYEWSNEQSSQNTQSSEGKQ